MHAVLVFVCVLGALMGAVWAWLGAHVILKSDHRAGVQGVLTVTSRHTGAIVFLAGLAVTASCLLIIRLVA